MRRLRANEKSGNISSRRPTAMKDSKGQRGAEDDAALVLDIVKPARRENGVPLSRWADILRSEAEKSEGFGSSPTLDL
jgi:hypothetical protein